MITPSNPPRRRLRIALFAGNYNYVMDGLARSLNTLVAYLEQSGHDVLVFAPTAREPALEHAGELISVPSVALPGKRSEYRFGLGLQTRARKKLDAFKPQLIHIASPDYTGYGALNYARKRAIPVVASFHTRFDTYPRYYGMSWLEKHVTQYMRYFYARCEHVYAPSRSMADELSDDGIGKDIRLWTRGIDRNLFHPDKRDPEWRASKGFDENDVVVAFVGRLVLEKGIGIFAEAFRQALSTTPHLKALIVGDGPERKAFQQKLPDGVFTGFLQGVDLARAYANADIFFNPSVTETFGNVTLEAMASGLPAVCARAAGSRSLVQDGKTGFLAGDHPSDFAAALVKLGSDQSLRLKMGLAARAKSAEFSWDAVLAELVSHYIEALDNFQPSERERQPSGEALAAISRPGV